MLRLSEKLRFKTGIELEWAKDIKFCQECEETFRKSVTSSMTNDIKMVGRGIRFLLVLFVFGLYFLAAGIFSQPLTNLFCDDYQKFNFIACLVPVCNSSQQLHFDGSCLDECPNGFYSKDLRCFSCSEAANDESKGMCSQDKE